jgi:toxin ParE1/3/4
MPKPVIPRARARRDIDEAVAYYLEHASERIALGFIDALERALAQVARHPASGSPRYAELLDLPALRAFPLRRYPFILFYVERESSIDIWRVLHGERDLPTWLREPTEP